MTVTHSAFIGSVSVPNSASLSAPVPGCTLGSGTAGDHLAIRALLADGGRETMLGEFQSQLDEPTYEPSDRLVVRLGSTIVSHVHLRNRELRFGVRQVPVTWFADLMTAPKFRRRGLASSLVAVAERQAQADGAELALVRTSFPHLFERRGWIPWGRPSYSLAGTREILADLVGGPAESPSSLEAVIHGTRPAPLTTRLWRHVEQAALERIYEFHTQNGYGAPVRNTDYWRWLVSRHAFDAIYVAVSGRDRWSLDAKGIVGYAIVKQDRVIELLTSPARPDAAESLMSRVCGEFIEQDRCDLRFEGAPNHPWHRRLVAAGGEYHCPDRESGQVMLARVLDPIDFLTKLRGELAVRARSANLPVGAELSIRFGSFAARIAVIDDAETGVNVQVECAPTVDATNDPSTKGGVECDLSTFTQWMLGHVDVSASRAEARARFPHQEAFELARTLFPQLPFWHPTWDDLRV